MVRKATAKTTTSDADTEATDATEPDTGSATQSDTDDAVEMLKADHRAVEALFGRYDNGASAQSKSALVAQVCEALIVHTDIENDIFYPACRDHGIDAALMDEAQVEHDIAGLLIEQLLAAEPGSPYYDAQVKVLSEYIAMHVREEEMPSSGILAQAQSAGLDMAALGRRMKSRKQLLEHEAERRQLHPQPPRSLGFAMHAHYGETIMASNYPPRDEYGRFMSDDDRRSYSRPRDDEGRFVRTSGSNYASRSYRRDDDDDRGRYGRSRDDEGRFVSSRRDDDRYGRDYDDDRYRYESRGRGWYGDPEGHSRAAERGWDARRDDRDDDRYSYSRRSDRDYADDRGQGGWFGDPRGHARAAELGWEHRREGDDDRSRSYLSRSDDDRSYSRTRGHGGWYGDPEGHSRAAQRGWASRYDDDDDRFRSGRMR